MPSASMGRWAHVRGLVPLLVAGVVATVLLAGAAVLRISTEDEGASLPARLLVLLLGTAITLVALLMIPRAPRLAWGLLTVAAGLGLLEAVAVIRTFEAVATGPAWRDLTLLGGLALVGGVTVAAGYADVNRWDASRLARGAVLLVLLGVVATTGAAIWAFLLAARSQPVTVAEGELTPLRFATRLALLTIAGAIAVGLGRDIGPAAARAGERLGSDPLMSSDRLWRYLTFLGEELQPGRAAEQRRAAEEERARLAADLHALVLPDLRRAAEAAASAGVPEQVQVDLRRALEDVEQLMHERQSIVLDQFGLVAALEWLAERTEERSPLRVELDVGASVPDGPGAISPAVARAAFRIALLGLDNVVRHAGARTARLYLSLDRMGLGLVIQDDGTAPAAVDGAGRPLQGPGGRGHADMRAEAAGSGGEIQIGSGPGARIDARWPLARVVTNGGHRSPVGPPRPRYPDPP